MRPSALCMLVCVYTHLCVHVFTCVYMYVCMCVCVHVAGEGWCRQWYFPTLNVTCAGKAVVSVPAGIVILCTKVEFRVSRPDRF